MVERISHMLRFLAITAAALLAASAAEARTVQLSDIIAKNGGVMPVGRFDIGGATIEIRTRQVALPKGVQELGRTSASKCGKLGQCAFTASETVSTTLTSREADLAFVAIYLNGGARITNLRLADIVPGGRLLANETLLVNGVSQRFGDIANLTFNNQLVLEFGGKRPGEFTLDAFELVETPIPGAGILMLSGIGGAFFAMNMRRRRRHI
jgi:hypothetical protein